jgi:hypothetical protein
MTDWLLAPKASLLMPMNMFVPRPGWSAFLLFLTLVPPAFAAGMPDGYKPLYEQKCHTASALHDFVYTDPKAWRFSDGGSGPAMELFQQSHYEPAVRSPLNIALIADKTFGDFVLEADLLSTKTPYPHQDMCLFFDVQNPTNFYYAHLAVAADPHAHNIFIVTNAPRLAIAKETTKGITWNENVWHHVKLERQSGNGSIKLYFDDMTRPIMIGEDKTLSMGGIGFGSFDDVGKIRNIRIWGRAVETRKTEFYIRP